jgi:hypothetical protein
VAEKALTASQFDENGTNIQNVFAFVGIMVCFNLLAPKFGI